MSDCPVDSNVYLCCSSNNFTCVMSQENGPHLHVLKCRNNLLWVFECIMNFLSFLAFWMHLECTYCKLMQDIHPCIYKRVNKSRKQLKQYPPQGSTKLWYITWSWHQLMHASGVCSVLSHVALSYYKVNALGLTRSKNRRLRLQCSWLYTC